MAGIDCLAHLTPRSIERSYPKLFQHPVWFVLPEEFSVPFLKGLLGTSADSKEVLQVLAELEASGALKS